MKRVAVSIFAFALLAAAAMCAGVSFDVAVPSGRSVTHAFLSDSPARLAEIRLASLVPSNSTAAVFALHTMADGSVSTNLLATGVSGYGVHSVTGGVRVLPGDVIRLYFSSATNGCCTIVLE